VLMMQMQDAGLTDRKLHTVTKFGNTTRSITQTKFKSVSAYFDGAGDYLEVASSPDFAFGSGDFTIEFWLYSTTSGQTIMATTTNSLNITREAGGQIRCYTALWGVFNGPTCSGSTWTHIAVQRRGSQISIYAGGSVLSSTASGAFPNSTETLVIGANSTKAAFFAGYIQDVRITKGVARYSGTITPPTEPFPAYDFSTTIGGIVKDHTGAFAARRVNIHSQATGELLGSTVSTATTGEWEFVVDQMCYAVAFDNEISKRKAIVFDRIEPA